MIIINAHIKTMAEDQKEYANGYLRIKDGKIAEIDSMQNYIAQDEDIVDAKGALLLPGFIDAHCHLGMWEDSLGFEGEDGNEETDPSTPHLRAIDAINPVDRCFSEAVAGGITSVVTGPGSANPIAGQMAAIKTAGTRIDRMILSAPASMKFAFGENPKSVYHGKNQFPMTRMATASVMREQLRKAQKYLQQLEEWEADKEGECDEPEYDAKCEALIPLLKGEIRAHFHAHRADDIFTAVRIAEEFHLNYAIVHGTEGHLIAEDLAAEQIDVITGPLLCDRSKPELKNLTPQNPQVLQNHGVRVAICTDHPVIPIQYLPVCAGLAVREGMTHDDALRAITINAAQIAGISNRVGSLEVGKDADIVLYSVDPLSIYAKPDMVFVNGIRRV